MTRGTRKKKSSLTSPFLATKSVSVDTIVFDGGHEWHDDFRTAAGHLLDAVKS